MTDHNAVVRQAGKPYAPPQIVEYGHIEKLTKGTAGANNDHGGKKAV
ncbi:MAG: lasso RiPP family leader peptide-containing protein [Terriglobales bacterium]